MDVELYHLGTSSLAHILHIDGECDAAICIHLSLVAAQIAQLELGVAQSMTKAEGRLLLLLVDPAIPHVDTLFVFFIDDVALGLVATFLAPCARISV